MKPPGKAKKNKGKTWKKGHSSDSNPAGKKHRTAAKNRFFSQDRGVFPPPPRTPAARRAVGVSRASLPLVPLTLALPYLAKQVPSALAFRSATHNTIFFINLGIKTV